MAEPFLVLKGVSKTFGATRALKGVDLEVRPDEFLVVLGPTGAGKTTLLRTIAGLETPEAGTVSMGGQDVTGWAPAPRDVALVFQNFSLYPRWTVRKNMEFPLRAPGRNLTEDEIRKRVEWAADLLKLTDKLEKPSVALSGGQMQRVAIGRAIVRRPKIFLLDEPLTNLDAKLREALRVELVHLRRELKTPMVFVTHDQAEALSMGDRVVVLSEGSVLQGGTPEEIYTKPVSLTVALQLGLPKINHPGVRRVGRQWCTDGGTPLLPAAAGPADERATLGIRPENLAPEGGDYDATVLVVENLGPAKAVLARWGDVEVHLVVPKGFAVRDGDRIRPRVVDPAAVTVWPRA